MEAINVFRRRVLKFFHLDDFENIELNELKSKPGIEPTNQIMTIASRFEVINDINKYFNSTDVLTLLRNPTKILLLNLQINFMRPKLTFDELNILSSKCAENSVVLTLIMNDGKNYYLYWKSKRIRQFLEFKLYDDASFMNDAQLFSFVSQFLADSLKRGHLGLHSQILVHNNVNTFELHLLADHRNYNPLLIAAEKGNSYIVNVFLNLGLNTEAHDTNAQILAWNGRHFEILLMLLKSNLTYPPTINIKECPDDIAEFHAVAQKLNDAMLLRDSLTVLKIVSDNPEMLHFYNLENESALAFALRHKLFDMYQLLISKNIIFGQREKFSDIKNIMKESERKELREIHYQESKFLPDNHMHVLLSNSRLGHNTNDGKRKREIIRKTFEVLNENPFIQLILMIVAASRNFRIIFDFSRDSVELIDPTANSSSKGMFYLTGRIYISAKQLLSANTEHETYGTLAHELCHYAINIVYENLARPYFDDDSHTKQEFEEISTLCEKNKDKEKIIGFVYKCYSSFMQHAELIVRVPHLIMHYCKNPDELIKAKESFGELFEFYEKKVFVEMKNSLPRIEANAEIEHEKKERKIIKFKLLLICAIFFSFVGIITVGFIVKAIFYKPTYSFSNLSIDQQNNVKNAPIIYKGEEIKFIDLFPDNHTAYNKLQSDHISKMLLKEPLNFNNSYLHYLDELVYHSWNNLTEKLKHKFLRQNFTFQGERLQFEMLDKSEERVFESLTSKQILTVLENNILKIQDIVKNESKFYLERDFFNENVYEIYYEFMNFLHGVKRYQECYFLNETKNETTFEAFYKDFTHKNFTLQIQKIKEINQLEDFKRCSFNDFKVHLARLYMNGIVTDDLYSHKKIQLGFSKVLRKAKSNKIFILSSEAGTGKTETFKQFTMRIKKKYPTWWVSYIDLKDFKKFYVKNQDISDVEKMLKLIFDISSENAFEEKFFESFFKTEK